MPVTPSISPTSKHRHGKRGRPRKPNALTPAQRAQRYRDKQRTGIITAAYKVLASIAEEAAQPFDRAAHEVWQRSLTEQADRIGREFQETMAAWDA